MRISFLLLIALFVVGCGGIRSAPVPAIPSPQPTITGKIAESTPPAKTSADAKEQAAEARAQVAFWNARVKVAEDEGKRLEAEERHRWLESVCRWAIAACIVGLIGNVALFGASFIWPWFERLRYVAAASAGAAVVLIFILWKLPAALEWSPHAAVVISVFALASIAAVVWHAHKSGRLHHDAEAILRAAKEQM